MKLRYLLIAMIFASATVGHAASFSFNRWATVPPAAGWSFVAGEFSLPPDPDGNPSEVMGYHPSDGSVWVGRNTGSAFSFTRWATVTPASGWSFVAGVFTSDSRSDVAAYHPSDGSIWVGANVD